MAGHTAATAAAASGEAGSAGIAVRVEGLRKSYRSGSAELTVLSAIDLEVKMIRRTVMHDLDFRIGQQVVVIAVSQGDRQVGRLPLGELLPSFRDGENFHGAESSEGLHVCGTDKPRADDSCLNSLHSVWRLVFRLVVV